LTFIISLFDGLNTGGIHISSINSFFIRVLPMYKVGLGWIVPAIIGGLIGFSIVQVKILLNYRSSRLNK